MDVYAIVAQFSAISFAPHESQLVEKLEFLPAWQNMHGQMLTYE